MLLDPTTIIFMSTLMGGAMSVVLYSAHLSFPKEIKGLNYWAGGLLSLVGASIFYRLRESPLGDVFPVLCMNALVLWGLGLPLIGTQKFYEKRPAWWLFHLIWVIGMIAMSYLCIVKSDFAAYIAALSFLVFVFFAYQAVLIWRFGEAHFSTKFFGLLMVLQSVAVMTRGILVLNSDGELNNLLAPGPSRSLYLATGNFMILLLTVGFMTVATRRLQTILERRSTLDPLTQVLNRRGFADIYARELALMRRDSSAMTMLSIDLDYFKKINDCHGHATGDRVLMDVASVIGRALRVTDHVARFGGEEFVVLLPATGLDRAHNIADRIQAALRTPRPDEACSTGQAPGALPPVTVSIGIACQISAEEDLDGILMRADKALYRAKENGRDRIEIAPDPAASSAPALLAVQA
jgi:diguanylate cyclase (GGDEF)-like protein